MPNAADAVIIGGGVIGCAAAYYLSTSGVRPLVLERGALGAEASGANAGMVGATSGIPGRTLAHTRKSLELLARDAEQLDRPVEFVRAGRLTLATAPEDWPAVEEFASTHRQDGADVRLLSGDEARSFEPALGASVVGAAYTPEDGHVNPFLLTYAYAAAARRNGAEIRQGITVSRVDMAHGRVVGVTAAGEQIASPLVIVAAGAWSAPLVAPAGIALPVRPGRGQMLVTAVLPPLTSRVLRSPLVSVRQDLRGHVLIGSSVEYVGFDRSVTLERMAEFSRIAALLAPALRDAPIIRAWAGLRPMTPDALPIIDTVPGVAGLVLATGHSRTGVTYAAVTAWLLAQLVTHGQTELPLDPFRLERFSLAAAHAGETGSVRARQEPSL
jgi:glycine/D-amino acid oxidase-like deaminating enzyme